MTRPEALNSPRLAQPIGPYSHAVRVGGLLFCTGQLPIDADGRLVADDPGEQARQCLENLAGVCAEAGTSLDHAIRVGVFLTDLSAFANVNGVYAEFLPHRPARTTVEVSALPLGAAVEIDAIVHCP